MDKENDTSKKPLNDSIERQMHIGQDKHFTYVVKKLERIATALHLVTNFLPDDEPLRNSIRQNAVSLLSDIYQVKKKYKADSTEAVSLSITADMEEMLSLLSIAHTSGFVSDMNYQILKRELDTLADLFGDDESITSLPKLSDDFFELEGDDPEVSESALSGLSERAVNTDDDTDSEISGATQGTQSQTADSDNETEEKTSPKKQRQKIILGLFEDNEEIRISDVESVIEGYSKKTLQRDLSSLVEKGILKKHGKRRWTSYTLADR